MFTKKNQTKKKKNKTKKRHMDTSLVKSKLNKTNHYPSIGILSVPMTIGKHKYTHSYIPASYIKWLEMNNARVIPIPYDTPHGAIDMILNQVNGVLFIGGQVDHKMIQAEYIRFIETFEYIFNHAKLSNNKGKYFPLFGICLGMEMLAMINEGSKNLIPNFIKKKGISDVAARNNNAKLHFIKKDAKILKIFSEEELDEFRKKSCVFQNHGLGFLEKASYIKRWNKHWDIVATSKSTDKKRENYVSILEYKKYPFYGLQFHPEKVLFEWEIDTIGRTSIFRTVSHKLSKFFVNECNKNKNKVTIPQMYIMNYNLWARNKVIAKIQPNKKLLKENHSLFENSYYFDLIS